MNLKSSSLISLKKKKAYKIFIWSAFDDINMHKICTVTAHTSPLTRASFISAVFYRLQCVHLEHSPFFIFIPKYFYPIKIFSFDIWLSIKNNVKILLIFVYCTSVLCICINFVPHFKQCLLAHTASDQKFAITLNWLLLRFFLITGCQRYD